MEYSNLKLSPHLVQNTLDLIESSLGYIKPNSFCQDFYPIFNPQHFHHNHLLLSDSKTVLAHIAVKTTSLNIDKNNYPLIMLGGIAVDPKHRGQGLYKKLMNLVLEKYHKEFCFALLWSDLDELYRPFQFYQVFPQYQLNQVHLPENNMPNIKLEKSKLINLIHGDKIQIQKLYQESFSKNHFTISRDKNHWNDLEQINSADLFILRNDQGIIKNYFLQNKGQDLQNIIYEYGTIDDLNNWILQIRQFGDIWTSYLPKEIKQNEYQTLTGAHCKILNESLFANFLKQYTKNAISQFQLSGDKVKFHFDGLQLEENKESFLQGILGPSFYQDLKISKPIFISGLDSI
jgi:hypothetical protein